jgi:hypothetical protein
LPTLQVVNGVHEVAFAEVENVPAAQAAQVWLFDALPADET